MARLFGTDGVRGIANKELTIELASNIGKACAYVLSKNKKDVKVIIGNDGRISKDMLVSSLISGLTSVGVDVIDLGTIPTPAISFLVTKYEADAGIMVSASHNPYEYNGIKIFDSQGFKLPDEIEDEIEYCITNNQQYNNDKIGKILNNKDAIKDYVDFLITRDNFDLSNLKIAIDTANGASSYTADILFSKTKCDYKIINNKPNGININDKCGALYLEQLSKFVKENKLDGGVAFDGDADRAIFVDEFGNIIDGDFVLSIISKELKDNNKLVNNTVVGTIMSNLGLKKYCEKYNINFIETKVGDRYILEEILKNNYIIGGEQSGHIILKEYSNTGDGQLTALVLFDILRKSKKKLSELSNIMKKYPQTLINVEVSNDKKNDFINNKTIQEEIKKCELDLNNNGRILVRASGTEPKIRVMVEGENTIVTEKIANKLASIISKELK